MNGNLTALPTPHSIFLSELVLVVLVVSNHDLCNSLHARCETFVLLIAPFLQILL